MDVGFVNMKTIVTSAKRIVCPKKNEEKRKLKEEKQGQKRK